MSSVQARRFLLRLVVAAAPLWASIGCMVVGPDGSDASMQTQDATAERFMDNVCYRCTVQFCSSPRLACGADSGCAGWIGCIEACPTGPSGVQVDQVCALRCTMPANDAHVVELATCIQDYSQGRKSGCERVCTETLPAPGAPPTAPTL